MIFRIKSNKQSVFSNFIIYFFSILFYKRNHFKFSFFFSIFIKNKKLLFIIKSFFFYCHLTNFKEYFSFKHFWIDWRVIFNYIINQYYLFLNNLRFPKKRIIIFFWILFNSSISSKKDIHVFLLYFYIKFDFLKRNLNHLLFW